MSTSNNTPPDPGCKGQASDLGAKQPLAQAARSLQELERPFKTTPADPVGVSDLALALTHSLAGDAGCRTALYTQAQLLDALFMRLVMRDIHSPRVDAQGIPHLRSDYLDMALRAQKQCRATIQCLHDLDRKNTSEKEKEKNEQSN